MIRRFALPMVSWEDDGNLGRRVSEPVAVYGRTTGEMFISAVLRVPLLCGKWLGLDAVGKCSRKAGQHLTKAAWAVPFVFGKQLL